MVGVWLFVLPVLAFRPDPSIFIGAEPARIRRFHKENQTRLRHGEAWENWLAGAGLGWMARFDERTSTPTRAWGPSIPLGKLANIESVEREIRKVFEASPDVLGIPLDQLVLGRSGYVQSSDSWLVQLDQVVPGTDIRVWRGGVKVRISKGNLVSFGVETYSGLDALNARPSVDQKVAQLTAMAAGPAGNAQHTEVSSSLKVLPLDHAGVIETPLVWEVRSKTDHPKGHWVSFVDAHTGALLHVYNEVRFLTGSVLAQHDVRTVNGEMDVSPLWGLRVQTDDEETHTDEDGLWELDGPVDPSGELFGEFLRVENKMGDDAFFDPLIGDGILTSEDATQAELDTWVFQGHIREWALNYAPELSMTHSQVHVNVNLNEHCNAYFDGSLNFFQAGSGCNNTGRIADVSYHEWGHGFHYYNLITGSFDGSISEGIGDAVAVLNTGDPTISPNFFVGGTGIREVSSNRVYPDDWVGEVHEDGLIFAGAVWDLWERLEDDMSEEEAYDTVNRLLVEATKSGPSIPDSFDEFILADDDNGDLSDGTPNSCAIIDAFSLHGLGPGGNGGSLIQLDHEVPSTLAPMTDIPIEAEGLNLAPECVDATMDGAMVHFSVDGGEIWQTAPMSGDLASMSGVIPGQSAGSVIEYYISLESEEGGSTRVPVGGEINPFTVYVGHLVELVCESFEEGDGGYTHSLISGTVEEGADDWTWGIPYGRAGDPDFAFSGEKVWGNDLGFGNYNGEYQDGKHNRLTSAPIDVGEHTQFVLQYRRWLTVEDGFYDQASILANGAQIWTNHASRSNVGDEHHKDKQWMSHVVAFGVDSGGLVEISFDMESDRGLTMGGWNIDDVCLFALTDAPLDQEEVPQEDGLDAPTIPDAEGKGCGCASAPSPLRNPWFVLLLTGMITAARRRGR